MPAGSSQSTSHSQLCRLCCSKFWTTCGATTQWPCPSKSPATCDGPTKRQFCSTHPGACVSTTQRAWRSPSATKSQAGRCRESCGRTTQDQPRAWEATSEPWSHPLPSILLENDHFLHYPHRHCPEVLWIIPRNQNQNTWLRPHLQG